MNVPYIEINQKGIATEVFIDGKKIHDVRNVKFERNCINQAPVLKMEFLATDMKISGAMVPDLPEALKPFYVKKVSPMDDLEIFYRSLTERERNLLNWAISLEKDSDDWKAINRLRRILSDEKQKVENR